MLTVTPHVAYDGGGGGGWPGVSVLHVTACRNGTTDLCLCVHV